MCGCGGISFVVFFTPLIPGSGSDFDAEPVPLRIDLAGFNRFQVVDAVARPASISHRYTHAFVHIPSFVTIRNNLSNSSGSSIDDWSV